MKKSADEFVETLTANEAVDYVSKHVGNRPQARALIIDAMHCGELTTTADAIWHIEDIDPFDDWAVITKNAPPFATTVELEPTFWRASGQWPAETRYWNWQDGNFIMNTSETPGDAFYGEALGNVQFYIEEVMALVGNTSRTGVGGRKMDREKWAEFWVKFIYSQFSGMADFPKMFPDLHALKQKMHESDDDGFSVNTIAFAAGIAWDGLVLRQAQDKQTKQQVRVSDE